MSEIARRARSIAERMEPRHLGGSLPDAEVLDGAIDELGRLRAEDTADEMMLRQTTHRLLQLRAAVRMGHSSPP